MEIIKEEIDSLAYGKSILKINNIDTNVCFEDFENIYKHQYAPLYVYARIPVEEIEKVHYLEQNGFNYVETQFKLQKRLNKSENMSIFGDDYSYVEVKDENELPEIYNISDRIMTVDRMILDKQLDYKLAQKRYHLYINKSFSNEDENLFKFIYNPTNEIIGYHTEKIVDSKNILFFIGGIIPEFRNTGACFALEYSTFNYLYNNGFKTITTHISAANYNIINFEMRTVGFKPKQTYIILRKIYKL